MPITGFNELVEELKLMREQFKEQQERQVGVNYQQNNGNDSS